MLGFFFFFLLQSTLKVLKKKKNRVLVHLNLAQGVQAVSPPLLRLGRDGEREKQKLRAIF
jgi:hypothetical protein